MAKIVLGMGTSHGPQILLPPTMWHMRVKADKTNASHYFNGTKYDFPALLAERGADTFLGELTPQAQQAKHDRCQAALGTLVKAYKTARPDVAIIVGNDQAEVFSDSNIAAFCVFRGDKIENIPKTAEALAELPAGVAPAMIGYCPPEAVTYPGHPALGGHIISSLIAEGFDVGQSAALPVGPRGENSAPHAYGFVYRKIMQDQVPPHTLLFVNTHNPPNRPTARRCVDLGRALARAVESWPTEARVAIIASGGLSHFVINADFDRAVLDAMQRGDTGHLAAIPEPMFEAGTAEIKNWLPVAGAMAELNMPMHLVDYVPCYRSEGGTGNAMGFVYWSR